MRINVNEKYAITSDTDQIIISTRGTYKSDQKVKDGETGYKSGDESLRSIAYVSTLEQAYRYLLHRQIRESPAVGFKAIMEEVKRIEDELKESITI